MSPWGPLKVGPLLQPCKKLQIKFHYISSIAGIERLWLLWKVRDWGDWGWWGEVVDEAGEGRGSQLDLEGGSGWTSLLSSGSLLWPDTLRITTSVFCTERSLQRGKINNTNTQTGRSCSHSVAAGKVIKGQVLYWLQSRGVIIVQPGLWAVSIRVSYRSCAERLL